MQPLAQPALASLPRRTPLLLQDGVWVKPEGAQPSGSVKYRMVHAKLRAALSAGLIRPGTALLEATSGSTGVALAMLGRRLGFNVELHAYETACPEKMARIRALGATLVLHPPEAPLSALLGRIAARVASGAAWHLGQYDRESTAAAYWALAGEVIGQCRDSGRPPPQVFCCPVGTGGLIQGVGRALREAFPGIRIVAVEPDPDTRIDGMRNTATMFLGDDDPYDPDFPDDRVTVPAPARRAEVGRALLGASGTAALDLLRRRRWGRGLVISPD